MTREHLIEVDEETLREIEGRQAFENLVADMNRGFMAQVVVAQAQVRRDRAHLESAPLVTNEGNLRPKAVINGPDYHYWGQRLGYECWDDPTFVNEYLRDNPESRVNAKMAQTSILNPWGKPFQPGLN
jgi:hypothetical protein